MAGAAEIKEGMVAWTADGEKAGRVIQLTDKVVVIAPGALGFKDYLVDPSHIDKVEGEDLYLTLDKRALESLDTRQSDDESATYRRRPPEEGNEDRLRAAIPSTEQPRDGDAEPPSGAVPDRRST